ncbi:MAG: dephospho-CoA kinase [Alicyclobacillus sp.]|nr:dephospho-CoA kinase [Alicyclobacillus sp.]
MIVGLTGGIATGKSTVTRILRGLGAYVVDADVWARRVVEPGSDGLRQVVAAFGPDILQPDGSLDRRALGRRVFADDTARARLNEIIHPLVRAGMKAETAAYRAEHLERPVVWDVPLLFEGETQRLVDTTVLVYVPEHVQLARLMARDGCSEADAWARIRAQMPIDEKRRRAAYVIDNSGELADTRRQVEVLWQTLCDRMAGGEEGGQ